MFTFVIDRFKGYFDNFRSDDFFKNQTDTSLLDISASRIQGWTDRHFLLVNSGAFDKQKVQDLNERIVLWNEEQLKPHLSSFSKNQIILFQNKPEFIPYFKPSKVYKLILSDKVQANDHFINFAWNSYRSDPTKRAALCPYLKPSITQDYSQLNKEELFHLMRYDLSLLRYLKPEWINNDLGLWMSNNLNRNLFNYFLDILDDKAKDVLYYCAVNHPSQGHNNWTANFRAFLQQEVNDNKFELIAKLPNLSVMTDLLPILEEYIGHKENQFKKLTFPISDQGFMNLWERGSKSLKHAIKGMIDERLFKEMSLRFTSSLFEFLGEDRFFELVKCNPENLKILWDKDKFIKHQFLSKFDLKLFLETIEISFLSDEDLKILIARDPQYFCKKHFSAAKRLSSATVQAFCDKGINLDLLPKGIEASDALKNTAILNELETEFEKLKRNEVLNYEEAKEAFQEKLSACKIQGERMANIKKRASALDDEDDVFLYTLYASYIDEKSVAQKFSYAKPKEFAERTLALLTHASKLGIECIIDLKRLGLYQVKTNGEADLGAILSNLRNLT